MAGREIAERMGWELLDDVLLCCVAHGEVCDEALEQWLQRLAKHDYRHLLICSKAGGHLNSRQRGRIGHFWKHAGRAVPRTAMLSDSQLERMVLTAIGWLTDSSPKAFPEGAWGQALAFLGTTATVADVSSAAAAIHATLASQERQSA